MKRKKLLALVISGAILVSNIFVSYNASAYMDPASADIAHEVGSEGVVMVKNENSVLPIDRNETVSVFGRTQHTTIRGGTGSGNVSVDYKVNIIDGMRNSGININEDLAGTYAAWCLDPENLIDDGASGSVGNMGEVPSNPEMPLTADEIEDAAEDSDVAVVVIGRNTGEGGDHVPRKWWDPNPELDAEYAAKFSTEIDENFGDYYLSENEEKLIENVTAAFDKVVAVMNVGTIMDMSWVEDYGVDSVVFGWQGGNETGNIIGDVLCGKTNPSGKLVDTIASSYDDYPSAGNFSNSMNSSDYVQEVYVEDIYVGYRYFETFAPEKVIYEFGYGLSYTTFEQKIVDFSTNASEIKVTVEVTNTGDVPGKEVVQVYYGAPQGLLGKPAKELAAYGKTNTLAPGETQRLTLTYDTDDMASYDDSGVTGHKSCYVLEAGDYSVYAGSSVKNVLEAGTYTVDSLVVTETLSEQMAVEVDSVFNRLTGDGTYQPVPTRTSPLSDIVYDDDMDAIEQIGDQGITLLDVYNETNTMDEFIAQFSNDDLKAITQGLGMSMPDMGFYATSDNIVYGAAGGFGDMEDYGIPAVTTADGPAGVRVDYETNGGFTQFPMATMVACTWNEELAEKAGQAIGTEAADIGVDSWLAPGMNIHRDPLGGRNFEYYSEDPLVTGITASAVTRGVQSKGVGVTIKHFAANNAEDNRNNTDSIVSERALREIYLKGFEIAVKTADPWYVMSCYNLINGTHGASSYELLTNILRKEWGFDGTVMTDWFSIKDDGEASMIRAQGDLCMAGESIVKWGPIEFRMMGSDLDVDADVADGKVTLAEVQRSAANVLNSAMKSLAFSDMYDVTDNLAYNPGVSWFATEKSDVYIYYSIAIDADETVTVALGQTMAAPGEEVSFTVAVDDETKQIDRVTVYGDNEYARAVVAVDGVYTFVMPAENVTIKVTLKHVDAPDTNNLEYIISIADNYIANGDIDDLTAAAKEEFNNAYNAAKKVLERAQAVPPQATQTEVNQAAVDLLATFKYLELKTDKEMLLMLIDLADSMLANADDYIPNSISGLKAVVNAAKAVASDDHATNQKISQMVIQLIDEIDKARLRPDKSALADIITQMQALDSKLYTAESFAILTTAVKNGIDIYEDENSDADTVNAAVAAIQEAYAGLVKVSEGSGSGSSKPDPSTPTSGSSNANGKTGGGSSPKTGDSLPVMAVVTAGFALATILIIKKQKTKK